MVIQNSAKQDGFGLDHIFGHNPWAQGGWVEPRGNWIPDQDRNDGISICGVVRCGRWIDLFAEDGTNSVAHVVIKPISRT